jgi:hypothetical protein
MSNPSPTYIHLSTNRRDQCDGDAGVVPLELRDPPGNRLKANPIASRVDRTSSARSEPVVTISGLEDLNDPPNVPSQVEDLS